MGWLDWLKEKVKEAKKEVSEVVEKAKNKIEETFHVDIDRDNRIGNKPISQPKPKPAPSRPSKPSTPSIGFTGKFTRTIEKPLRSSSPPIKYKPKPSPSRPSSSSSRRRKHRHRPSRSSSSSRGTPVYVTHEEGGKVTGTTVVGTQTETGEVSPIGGQSIITPEGEVPFGLKYGGRQAGRIVRTTETKEDWIKIPENQRKELLKQMDQTLKSWWKVKQQLEQMNPNEIIDITSWHPETLKALGLRPSSSTAYVFTAKELKNLIQKKILNPLSRQYRYLDAYGKVKGKVTVTRTEFIPSKVENLTESEVNALRAVSRTFPEFGIRITNIPKKLAGKITSKVAEKIEKFQKEVKKLTEQEWARNTRSSFKRFMSHIATLVSPKGWEYAAAILRYNAPMFVPGIGQMYAPYYLLRGHKKQLREQEEIAKQAYAEYVIKPVLLRTKYKDIQPYVGGPTTFKEFLLGSPVFQTAASYAAGVALGASIPTLARAGAGVASRAPWLARVASPLGKIAFAGLGAYSTYQLGKETARAYKRGGITPAIATVLRGTVPALAFGAGMYRGMQTWLRQEPHIRLRRTPQVTSTTEITPTEEGTARFTQRFASRFRTEVAGPLGSREYPVRIRGRVVGEIGKPEGIVIDRRFGVGRPTSFGTADLEASISVGERTTPTHATYRFYGWKKSPIKRIRLGPEETQLADTFTAQMQIYGRTRGGRLLPAPGITRMQSVEHLPTGRAVGIYSRIGKSGIFPYVERGAFIYGAPTEPRAPIIRIPPEAVYAEQKPPLIIEAEPRMPSRIRVTKTLRELAKVYAEEAKKAKLPELPTERGVLLAQKARQEAQQVIRQLPSFSSVAVQRALNMARNVYMQAMQATAQNALRITSAGWWALNVPRAQQVQVNLPKGRKKFRVSIPAPVTRTRQYPGRFRFPQAPILAVTSTPTEKTETRVTSYPVTSTSTRTTTVTTEEQITTSSQINQPQYPQPPPFTPPVPPAFLPKIHPPAPPIFPWGFGRLPRTKAYKLRPVYAYRYEWAYARNIIRRLFGV